MTADFSPGLFPFAIRSSDTDFADQLHLASLFALMQEAAYQHAEQVGIGASTLDPADLTWLLSKVSVRLDRLPRWGEQVWIRTWTRGVKKLLFLRDYQLLAGSPDSEPIGRATSEWLVARKSDHRPQRPDVVLGPAGLQSVALEIPEAFDFNCRKIDPAEGMDSAAIREPLLIKFADFSEIDRNHHVNNTHYVAWSMDAAYAYFRNGPGQLLGSEAKPLDLAAIDIQYLSEIRPGERTYLDIHPILDPNGSAILVEGLRADQTSAAFRARLTFRQT